MTINIQYIHMTTSEAMNEHVTEKLNKLALKYDWIISAQVIFENIQKEKEEGKICKIELSAPGPRIFASSQERTYEGAVKNTINDLEIQLKKRKQTFAHS
ncbi:ribosomal subunit interface protein [Formosa agariphila KMM 3901]|uniref:Ribosomal subunit interface protein n=1 Tax=Formosa agariphila (strain DSM 15362 / KCTC 12365 / LMG 23005 / KMM 3901 / M-2Alg 35-1) TaxID=1347342 RepID=T2KL97_FORAG|nr:HPF/RaiA family ribosome-associated protein [Formosa agariphila]CDF79672.1 ribosomal subunit interface protein [Formosa agariphila KMM 3901]